MNCNNYPSIRLSIARTPSQQRLSSSPSRNGSPTWRTCSTCAPPKNPKVTPRLSLSMKLRVAWRKLTEATPPPHRVLSFGGKAMIKEHDRIVLTEGLLEESLKADD